jgi:hypothetical protein
MKIQREGNRGYLRLSFLKLAFFL